MGEAAENYYDTLGVEKDADKAAIKKAYRKQARKHHPDMDGGNLDTFQRVQRAYMVLYDPKARERYDRTGDGGEHVPTTLETAYENLAVLFSVIFQKNLVKIESLDIISAIKKQVADAMKEPKANIVTLKKRIKLIKAAQKRLSRKKKRQGAPDIFEHVMGTELQLANKNMAAEQENLDMFAVMIELSEDYDYQFDAPVKAPPVEERTFAEMFGPEAGMRR